MIKTLVIIYSLTFLVQCKAKTNEEKMKETANAVLKTFQLNRPSDFENMIGVKLLLIGKNSEIVKSDFYKYKSYYNRYLRNKVHKIDITDEYDDLGRRKVLVQIYRGYDTVNNISEVQLELYFGPPQFVPLNKISSYKIVVKENKSPVILQAPEKF